MMSLVTVRDGIVFNESEDIVGNLSNHVIRLSSEPIIGSGVILGNSKDGFVYNGRSVVAGYGVRVGHCTEGLLYRSGKAILKSGDFVGRLSDCKVEGNLTDDDRMAIWHFLVKKIF